MNSAQKGAEALHAALSNRSPTSIPTEYNGTKFRSRFEAEFARGLDTYMLGWQYEPQSFLLPSGVHFWPDFRVEEAGAWIELRGYTSTVGEQQIAEFPGVMEDGEIFFVIRANGNRSAKAKWPDNHKFGADRAGGLIVLSLLIGQFCEQRYREDGL